MLSNLPPGVRQSDLDDPDPVRVGALLDGYEYGTHDVYGAVTPKLLAALEKADGEEGAEL